MICHSSSQLDEWFHPDLAAGELPSACETFRMLAEAISTGDAGAYKPARKANTHWRNAWRWTTLTKDMGSMRRLYRLQQMSAC
jgi:hypothetical protein